MASERPIDPGLPGGLADSTLLFTPGGWWLCRPAGVLPELLLSDGLECWLGSGLLARVGVGLALAP